MEITAEILLLPIRLAIPAAGGIDLVVDNTAPGITNSNPNSSVKEDGTIVINGSGFAETATSSPIATFANNGVNG